MNATTPTDRWPAVPLGRPALLLLLGLALSLGAACDDDGGSSSANNAANNGAPCEESEAGTEGCQCFPDRSCLEGLSCAAEVCVGEGGGNNASNNGGNNASNNGGNNASNNSSNNGVVTGLRLQIDAPGARSCELVLSDPEEVLAEVEFADGVEGRTVPRGRRTALAFIREADEGFAADAVRLTVRGDESAAESLSVMVAYCFDRDGEALDGATIAVAP